MKMGQSFRCLFWAILYCVLYLVSASDEDLMDFDFGDLKEIDWSYENNNDHDILNKATTAAKENSITFDDDIDFLEEDDDQMQRYDWREKMLRTALSKALTNKVVRQKFIEVMPILRVLSKQQKLALSALITAQFSAKKGNELRLDQVRMMFGDDKSLILPVVYDIANLVKNSAKKYIEFDYSIQDLANFGKTKSSADRRKLELTSTELAEEENNEGIGTLPYTAADASKEEEQGDDMEDFMEDMPEEFLDPMEINKELLVVKEESSKNNNTEILKQTEDTEKEKSKEKKTDIPIEDAAAEVIVDHPLKINHELQKDVPTLELIKGNIPTLNTEEDISKVPTTKSTTTPIPLRRTRRATENRAFVHKLIRSVPASVNEADLQRGLGGRTLKLNTTAFATPKETTLTPLTTTTPVEVEQKPSNEANPDLEPYQIVEDLAFASLNGTEIVLNDEDEPQEREVSSENSNPDGELLPTPEELIAGPRYRVAANKLIRPAKGKRVPPKQIRTRPQQGSGVTPPKKCERFTASMCIRTEDYPMDLIMGSIRRHRNAMTALLAEYTDRQYSAEFGDDFEDFNQGKKRRQDTNEVHSGLCQSIVRYARPQKARSASGEWKFIVNTGKHTQTLRLEKCTNPQETCSYLSSSYKSYCSQVYNYHRLLSWDKTRGLHVDIFKVPTCCSCQINGIRQQQFAAAVGGTFTKKDFTPIPQKPQEVYRPDSFDYTEDDEEEDEDDLAFNIRNYHHYKHDTSFDANELLSGGSNKVKTKVPSPTVGSYLSPPDNDEFGQYPYKLTRDSSNIFKPSAPGPSPSLSSSASSSVSASSSNKILRELARRRPHKSFSNDYQSDLEFSPSEHHAEREVNVYGTPNGKQDRTQHTKIKPLYSVIHTGGSNDNTTAITSSTGTIRAQPSETLHHVPTTGRPRTVTNAHQKSPAITDIRLAATDTLPAAAAGDGAALFEPSVPQPTPTSAIRTASLPTHYYTHAAGGRSKSKPRLRVTGAKATTTTTAAPTTIAETTEYSETSSKRKVIPSITSDVFRNTYKAKLNLTSYYSPTAATISSSGGPAKSSSHPPKRINYSYHPIIDFFEYNRKIQTATSTGGTTATTTSTSVSPRPSSTLATRRVRVSTKPPYHLSSTQLYSHKIPNAVPATIYQQPQVPERHTHTRHQNERRIGYGAAGDGSRVTSHTDSSSSRFFPIDGPTPDTSYPQEDTEVADVWHPVIVENF